MWCISESENFSSLEGEERERRKKGNEINERQAGLRYIWFSFQKKKYPNKRFDVKAVMITKHVCNNNGSLQAVVEEKIILRRKRM